MYVEMDWFYSTDLLDVDPITLWLFMPCALEKSLINSIKIYVVNHKLMASVTWYLIVSISLYDIYMYIYEALFICACILIMELIYM